MKPRVIRRMPVVEHFAPLNPSGVAQVGVRPPVVMSPDEYEALRLVDHRGLMQEEAAQMMGVSRGTVWRCLDSARRKVASAVVEGRELVISYESVPQKTNQLKSEKG